MSFIRKIGNRLINTEGPAQKEELKAEIAAYENELKQG